MLYYVVTRWFKFQAQLWPLLQAAVPAAPLAWAPARCGLGSGFGAAPRPASHPASHPASRLLSVGKNRDSFFLNRDANVLPINRVPAPRFLTMSNVIVSTINRRKRDLQSRPLLESTLERYHFEARIYLRSASSDAWANCTCETPGHHDEDLIGKGNQVWRHCDEEFSRP